MARRAMEVAQGHNDLARQLLRGAHGVDLVAARRARGPRANVPTTSLARTHCELPHRRRGARAHPRRGRRRRTRRWRTWRRWRSIGWEVVAKDQTEGVSLALAAAACGALGEPVSDHAATMYEQMRPYAGTTFVIRAPAAAMRGPADHYLGTARRGQRRPRPGRGAFRGGAAPGAPDGLASPSQQPPKWSSHGTLRQRGREGEEERIAVLLRNAEESAIAPRPAPVEPRWRPTRVDPAGHRS